MRLRSAEGRGALAVAHRAARRPGPAAPAALPAAELGPGDRPRAALLPGFVEG